MPKRLTDDAREMFEAFTFEYPFCWACGIPDAPQWVEAIHIRIDYPRHMERAHIIGGSGRVHDRRNLAMLCKLCHDLSHGATIRVGSKVLPNLRLDHLLWLQMRFEQRVDRPFLRELLRRPGLPTLRAVPIWHRTQFNQWQGVTHVDYRKEHPRLVA
jgi:hypothetical protein